MWLLFAVAFALLTTIVVTPGLLLVRALGTRNLLLSLSLAPSISLAMYALLGVMLGTLGIFGAMATVAMLACPLAFGAVALALSIRAPWYPQNTERVGHGRDWMALLAFVAVALCVVTLFFVKSLDGPASFSQQADNVAHLSAIAETALDGNYSLLETCSYPLSDILSGAAPFSSVGFYPNGFYVIASFAVSLLGVSAPLAENAALLVFAGVVYPLSSFGLMRLIFDDDLRTLLGGALATSAFAAFPLAMFTFGPIYPNMAAFCCVPAVILSFMRIFEREMPRHDALLATLVFLLCSVGAAALQPNAIFTSGVFLIPYCCHLVLRAARSHGLDRRWVWALVGASLSLVCCVWAFLVYGPVMRNVTSFDWPALDDPMSGLGNLLSLALRLDVPQYVLAAVLIVGLLSLLRDGQFRWLACSYLLMAALYYAGNSFEGGIKQLLTGFWYTDQWRTAASVAIVGAPVAAKGFSEVIQLAQSLAGRAADAGTRPCRLLPAIATWAAMAVLVFCPVSFLPPSGQTAAFGRVAQELEQLNHLGTLEGPNSYTEEERAFVGEVREIVGPDTLLLNMPADGSVYAYLDGSLNLYYKSALQGGETRTSELIRLSLSDLDVNSEVRDAVRGTGASYVILLERNGFVDQGDLQWTLCFPYQRSQWSGMDVDELDSLESLRIVLEHGNMRLYRIDL